MEAITVDRVVDRSASALRQEIFRRYAASANADPACVAPQSVAEWVALHEAHGIWVLHCAVPASKRSPLAHHRTHGWVVALNACRTPEEQRVCLCRAFAAYLAARCPRLAPATPGPCGPSAAELLARATHLVAFELC